MGVKYGVLFLKGVMKTDLQLSFFFLTYIVGDKTFRNWFSPNKWVQELNVNLVASISTRLCG